MSNFFDLYLGQLAKKRKPKFPWLTVVTISGVVGLSAFVSTWLLSPTNGKTNQKWVAKQWKNIKRSVTDEIEETGSSNETWKELTKKTEDRYNDLKSSITSRVDKLKKELGYSTEQSDTPNISAIIAPVAKNKKK